MGFIRENRVSLSPLSVTAAAYVAGVLDGEGSISLSVKRRDLPHARNPMVRVANTNLDLLEHLVALTGNGAIYERRSTGVAHRRCLDWMLTANQIRFVLPQVLPFLVIKRRQAELVLEYLGLIEGRRGIPESLRDRAKAIIAEIHDLNERGNGSLLPRNDDMGCSEIGCRNRRYQEHEWCYPHWIERQPLEEKPCAHCGEPFRAVRGGETCSQRCANALWWSREGKAKREAEMQARPLNTCPTCGKDVDQSGYKGKQYCNEGCYAKHRQAKKYAAKHGLPEPANIVGRWKEFGIIGERECPVCGERFEQKNGKQKYCGNACNQKAFAQRKKEQRE